MNTLFAQEMRRVANDFSGLLDEPKTALVEEIEFEDFFQEDLFKGLVSEEPVSTGVIKYKLTGNEKVEKPDMSNAVSILDFRNKLESERNQKIDNIVSRLTNRFKK